MKRILSILALSLLFFGCSDKDELIFDYEYPQFETNPGFILMEVVLPQGTPDSENVFIVGDFNGGEEAAVGNAKWQLKQSPGNSLKWGIYLDPADFVAGKTLADGYYFHSWEQGKERTVQNEDILHYETAPVGDRINYVRVSRWAKYFEQSEVDWPTIPMDLIQLRFTVPAYTPVGYQLAVVGVVNGWNAGDLEKWTATPVDDTHYYLNIDPADMQGDGLAEKFFLNVIAPGQEWWYHQNNDDGSGGEGPGLTVPNATKGRAYEIEIANWRNSADLPQGIPTPPADKFMLLITVPDYTPANSLIGLFGEWNGWDAMLNDPAKWTFTAFDASTYYLMVDPKDVAEGKTVKDMFHITLYYETSTGANWWKHQANEDGSADEGAGINNANNPASPQFDFAVGKTYNIQVKEWRNSEDIKGSGEEPEDVSVAPWPGLTVEAGKILLQIEVPGYTPNGARIALCGTASGWGEGANRFEKFGATQLSEGRYYIQLDPNDFEAGTSLADEFKFGLLHEGQEWWYHESNAFRIKGTEAGKAYLATITEWGRKEEIPGVITFPELPEGRIGIDLFVPDYTPANATIVISGDINDWNGADLTKWQAQKVTDTRYFLPLDPANFKAGTGLTKETTANGFSFAILVDGKEWYYFQSEGGNLLLPNGAETGKSYPITITDWKNASEL